MSDTNVIIELLSLAERWSSFMGKPYALVELKDGSLTVVCIEHTRHAAVSKVLEIVSTAKGGASWRHAA